MRHYILESKNFSQDGYISAPRSPRSEVPVLLVLHHLGGFSLSTAGNTTHWVQCKVCMTRFQVSAFNPLLCVFFCGQILVGELCAFFTKAEGTQEKTIVTADCCYFNPLLRRIIRFLGELTALHCTISLLFAGLPMVGLLSQGGQRHKRVSNNIKGCENVTCLPLQFIIGCKVWSEPLKG